MKTSRQRKFSFKSVLDRNLNAKHTGGHEIGSAAKPGVHYLLGGSKMFMILSRHSKYSIGGWTIVDMFIFMLAASLPAFLVSMFFDREWRILVFFICFVAFNVGFYIFTFHWLLPTLARHQRSRPDKEK